MKYKVKANPKAGTCFQTVEANSVEEAIEKAWANPNDWQSPKVVDRNSWTIRAYPQ